MFLKKLLWLGIWGCHFVRKFDYCFKKIPMQHWSCILGSMCVAPKKTCCAFSLMQRFIHHHSSFIIICWWKNDRAHQKIKLFAGCVWRVEVQNGSVLVPKPIFDGKPLMTSLPHLKNLHFWVSFRKHKEPRGLGKGVATLPIQPQSISIRLSLGLGWQNAALRSTCWKTTLDPRGMGKGRPVCQLCPNWGC